MPKISVIVPVYNMEKYLGRCVDSLVNQTLEDIEIILVNDASTDNSLQFMNIYKKKYPQKIELIDSKVNKKQGGARNLGLKIAKGDYIAFLDSDDWAQLDMYEKMYKKAIQENCDIVFCDAIRTTDGINGNYLKMVNDFDMGDISDEKRQSLILKPGSCCNKIIKRELLIDNNILFPENMFYEDNCQAVLPMYYVQKCGYIKEPLYKYFINPMSTTEIVDSNKYFDRCRAALEYMKQVKQRGFYEKYKTEVDFWFENCYYHSVAVVCVSGFKKLEFKKLYEIRNYMKNNNKNCFENPYFHQTKEIEIYLKLLMFSPIIGTIVIKVIQILRSIKKVITRKAKK